MPLYPQVLNSQSQTTAYKNFDPRLVKSKDMTPVDMEGQQHIHLKIARVSAMT